MFAGGEGERGGEGGEKRHIDLRGFSVKRKIIHQFTQLKKCCCLKWSIDSTKHRNMLLYLCLDIFMRKEVRADLFAVIEVHHACLLYVKVFDDN